MCHYYLISERDLYEMAVPVSLLTLESDLEIRARKQRVRATDSRFLTQAAAGVAGDTNGLLVIFPPLCFLSPNTADVLPQSSSLSLGVFVSTACVAVPDANLK